MAYKVEKSLTTAGVNATRILFYLYRFFKTTLPTTFPGRVTILSVGGVEQSNAGGGDWLSETGPLTGAWFVVECQYTWGTTPVKWQAIFGARNAAGTIAGIAGAVTGLVAGFAPNGGWDSVATTFGASLFSGLKYAYGGGALNNNATAFHLSLVERLDSLGVADNAAFMLIGDDSISGTWETGFYLGATYPFVAARQKPGVFLYGAPSWNGATAWISAGHGSYPDVAYAAFNEARTMIQLELNGGIGQEQVSHDLCGFPQMYYDSTLSKAVGWLCEVFRHDSATADGTTNTALTRIVYNGIFWPWEP